MESKLNQRNNYKCLRNLLSPMTKAPKPTENPKSNVTTQKNNTKTSIAKRLRTDSVGVTTATQMVWLNRLTKSQPYDSYSSFAATEKSILPQHHNTYYQKSNNLLPV